MRLSRPCYDKYHRCPGWAGGGMHYAKVTRCDNGTIVVDYDDRWWEYKFQRCNKCDVVVLPYRLILFAPSNIKYTFMMWLRDIPYRWVRREHWWKW